MVGVQEQSTVAIFLYLIGQTIAVWKKLSKIEQKIDIVQKHNDEQDKKINKIMKVMADKVAGAAKELIT